jgi:hypothetical protein
VNILNVLSGYKTYIAAAGLFGLSLYQLSQGQYDQAGQSILAALAAAGLRSAIAKVPAAKAQG